MCKLVLFILFLLHLVKLIFNNHIIMKKFLIFSVLLNLVITGTVMAAVQVNSFPDVQSGSYYEKAVLKMTTLGVIKGMDDGLFHPDDAVNRAQAVVMLDRYNTYLEGRVNDLQTLVCMGMNENTSADADYVALYKKTCQGPM